MKPDFLTAAKCLLLAVFLIGLFPLRAARSAAGPVGIFEGQGDVGNVLHKGSVEYDAASKTYTLAGSGENMWFGKDEFFFVWTKVSGDFSLSANIDFIGAGSNPHRKAVLMIRQTLDTDSVYADAALHGVGLTSLQFRDTPGADTREVQAAISAPRRLTIEKRSDAVRMLLSPGPGDPSTLAGAVKIPFHDPVYVGIGVCSHDKDVVEKAVFSAVHLEMLPPASTPN